MGKVGIDFRIKEDGSFEIGTSKKGKIKGLYLPFKQKNEKTNFTLKEIFEEIIEKARKQHAQENWNPCPRNIGSSITTKINSLFKKINNENKNQLLTNNKKYLKETEIIINSFKNKPYFTEKEFKEESTKAKIVEGRNELNAQETNRMHIETFICKGIIKKTQQGDGENEYINPQAKRSATHYTVLEKRRIVCPYYRQITDGVYQCTCKNFKKTPKNILRNEEGFE